MFIRPPWGVTAPTPGTPEAPLRYLVLHDISDGIRYISMDWDTGTFTTIASSAAVNDYTVNDTIVVDEANSQLCLATPTNDMTTYEYDGSGTLALNQTISGLTTNQPWSFLYDVNNDGYALALGEGPFGHGLTIFSHDHTATPNFVNQLHKTWANDQLRLLMDFRSSPGTTYGDRWVAWAGAASQVSRAFTVSGTTVTDTGSVTPTTSENLYKDITWDRDTGQIIDVPAGEFYLLDTSTGALSANGTASITYANITAPTGYAMVNEDILGVVGDSGSAVWLETFDVSSQTFSAVDTYNLTSELSFGNNASSIWADPFIRGRFFVISGAGQDWANFTSDASGNISNVGVNLNIGYGMDNLGGFGGVWWLQGPLSPATVAREFTSDANRYEFGNQLWADGQELTAVFCIQPRSWTANLRIMGMNAGIAASSWRIASEQTGSTYGVRISGWNSSNTLVLNASDFDGAGYQMSNNTWHAVMIAANMATGVVKIYIDGVDVTESSPTITTGQTINFDSGASQKHLWSSQNGAAGNAPNYSSAIWMTDTYYDPATYWSTFFDGSNKPIYQGSDGSDGVGVQPVVYAPGGNLADNLGSGGNWTEVGTVPIAPSAP